MTIKYSLREPMAPGNTLMEKFQTLKELGFAGIEITDSSTADFADEIKAATDATGIVPNILLCSRWQSPARRASSGTQHSRRIH